MINPVMAERRRRTQEVTGKIGYVPPPDAYQSAQADREAADAKDANRKRAAGNLRSVGAFVNAPGADHDISYHRPTERDPAQTSPLPGFYAEEPFVGSPGRDAALVGKYAFHPPPGPVLASHGGRVSPYRRASPTRQPPGGAPSGPGVIGSGVAAAGGVYGDAYRAGRVSPQRTGGGVGSAASGSTEKERAAAAEAAAAKGAAAAAQAAAVAQTLAAARLTSEKEFGSLMDMVYTNHAEAQRNYLTFRPDAPLF